MVQCHGSFATATCMKCKHKVDAKAIREDIFSQRIPKCSKVWYKMIDCTKEILFNFIAAKYLLNSQTGLDGLVKANFFN